MLVTNAQERLANEYWQQPDPEQDIAVCQAKQGQGVEAKHNTGLGFQPGQGEFRQVGGIGAPDGIAKNPSVKRSGWLLVGRV